MENHSYDIEDYHLPVKPAESMKNFAPVKAESHYSMDEIIRGDTAGSTETDSKTAPKSGNYSKINQK